MEQNYGTYGTTGSTALPGHYSGSPTPSGQYATEVTVKSTRIVDVNPYFDVHYFRTWSGILKVIEIVSTFIAFIITVSTWSSHVYTDRNGVRWASAYAIGSADWTAIVTFICFVVSLVLLALYLFHIVEKYQRVPWLIIELLYCLAVAFCLVIAGAVMIPAAGDPARGAVVFFCWVAALAYFVEAFLKFRAYRADESPQGI